MQAIIHQDRAVAFFLLICIVFGYRSYQIYCKWFSQLENSLIDKPL
jgi:hypothetical protein